jgi:hypothetical protein
MSNQTDKVIQRNRIASFLIIGVFTFAGGIYLFNWLVGTGMVKFVAKGLQLFFIIEVSFPLYWAWTWKDRQYLTSFGKAFWRFQATRIFNLTAGWLVFVLLDLVFPTGASDVMSILFMAWLNFKTGDTYVFNDSQLPIQAWLGWWRSRF